MRTVAEGTGNVISDRLEQLYRRRRFGIEPGLEIERALLERLGNPQRSFAAVHVAGTNGKGSVCRLVDSILTHAGLGVGLYTSPHLVAFNERMTFRGAAISDPELETVLDAVETAATGIAVECGREPTFFEVATAAAMVYFRGRGVRIAVLETGMGGRWDATNVAVPVVSAITRIGVEHTEYLGADIETIAAEKCGIIKKGIPVVCGGNSEEASRVVKQTAARVGSPCVDAVSAVSVRVVSAGLKGQKVTVETETGSYGTMTLPLAGKHQLENLATALCCVEIFGQACGIELVPETVRKGVEAVRWPGRFQVISTDPVTILDAAHNPNAAQALAGTLKEALRGEKVWMVIGMCDDKDIAGFLHCFRGIANEVWAVPLNNERGAHPEKIVGVAKAEGMRGRESTPAVAIEEARQRAREKGGVVCITGSIFLAGEVLGMIQEASSSSSSIPWRAKLS